MDLPTLQVKDLSWIELLFFHTRSMYDGDSLFVVFGIAGSIVIALFGAFAFLINLGDVLEDGKGYLKENLVKLLSVFTAIMALYIGVQWWTVQEIISESVASKNIELLDFEMYDAWYSNNTLPLIKEQEPEEAYVVKTLLKIDKFYGKERDPRIEKVMEYYGVTEAYQVQYLSKKDNHIVKVAEYPVFLVEGADETILSLYNVNENETLDTLPKYGLLAIKSDEIAGDYLSQ